MKSFTNMLFYTAIPFKKLSKPPSYAATGRKYILIGNGAFDSYMKRLNDSGWSEFLRQAVRNESNIMGICVGAQVLGLSSEEGREEGLGFLQMRTKSLNSLNIGSTRENLQLKVPNVGLQELRWRDNKTSINTRISSAYFSHSYFMHSNNPVQTVCWALEPKTLSQIPAMVVDKNIIAVQFHPEKSNRNGIRFLSSLFKK